RQGGDQRPRRRPLQRRRRPPGLPPRRQDLVRARCRGARPDGERVLLRRRSADRDRALRRGRLRGRPARRGELEGVRARDDPRRGRHRADRLVAELPRDRGLRLHLLMPTRTSPWWPASVALAAVLVYAGALRNGFALDDVPLVRDNPAIASLTNVPRLL